MTTTLQTICFGAAVGWVSASFDTIESFQPLSMITDHAAVSFDQTAMETLLAGKTQGAFDQAQLVYEDGGNSKSFAVLSIPGGLPRDVLLGTQLSGRRVDGVIVVGTANDNYSAGDLALEFLYPISDDQEDHLDCRVGGLPENEILERGCLVEAGTITIDPSPDLVGYGYNLRENNRNGRTLQYLSSTANSRMRLGGPDDDYLPAFETFFNYYGAFDYADQIVRAALEGRDTSLARGDFNLVAARAGFDAREEIAKKGAVYLAVAMNVIRELEKAVHICDAQCSLDSDCGGDLTLLHPLDEAVAYYFGADDNFLHALANKRCANFATCAGDPVNDIATVNENIFALFGSMQSALQLGNCDGARPLVKQITSQIWVPIVQGTLRYAWILDDRNNPGALLTDKSQAEGAIFAAGVLPVVHACNPDAAATIYNNMSFKANIRADYTHVKAAFEQCYSEMGIDCADIGGIVNNAGNNYDSDLVRPCNNIDAFASASSSVTVAFGALISLFAVVGLAL